MKILKEKCLWCGETHIVICDENKQSQLAFYLKKQEIIKHAIKCQVEFLERIEKK